MAMAAPNCRYFFCGDTGNMLPVSCLRSMKLETQHAASLLHRALAEEGGADAHAGGAFFDSDFKVMRHPHGQLFHGNGLKFAGGDGVTKLAKLAEKEARILRLFTKGRNGHESVETQ